MRIVVCIKQVPDPEKIAVDKNTGLLNRQGVPLILNPFDAYALEFALRLKEAVAGDGAEGTDGAGWSAGPGCGETLVTAVSMGPPQAEEVLREALAMGAHAAVLLCDRAFAGADTLATSRTLAQAIKTLGDDGGGAVDVAVCGKQSVDGETSHVGPQMAYFLGMPVVTCVKEFALEGAALRLARAVEGGTQTVEVAVPVVITVDKTVERARRPSLRGLMAAKKLEIPVWTAKDLRLDEGRVGAAGSPTRVKEVFEVRFEKRGKMIEGDAVSQVEQLISELKRLGLV